MPRRALQACNTARQSHLPRRDAPDGTVRRVSHAPRSDGSGLRGGRRPGDLHHRAADLEPRGHGDTEMIGNEGAGHLGWAVLLIGGLAAPLHAQTSLTIYNDGRVLVRREL